MSIGPDVSGAPLIDPMRRPIDRLRVSVTDRCNFRCSYCLDAHPKFAPRAAPAAIKRSMNVTGG